MTVEAMANFIRKNKPGINYPGNHTHHDTSLVLQYTRHALVQYVHITDEHIFECCAKAESFEEHIKLCLPIAKIDTEKFRLDRLKPPAKGRTKRRFR